MSQVLKGKGFAGVMKRHGFSGGRATHGSMFTGLRVHWRKRRILPEYSRERKLPGTWEVKSNHPELIVLGG